MKIALGTAQFGLDYGVANTSGLVDPKEVSSILIQAARYGIDILDTAPAYGKSERTLGMAGIDEFSVVSKLPSLPPKLDNITHWVHNTVSDSLQCLGVNSLYGLLLHNPMDLFGPHGKALVAALQGLKEDCSVQKIGVSIYNPSILSDVTRLIDLDLVQAPMNILDRNLTTSGWLDKLKESNVEVHCRSLFLQGLLLMPRAEIPQRFEKWASIWDHWEGITEGSATLKLQLCIDSISSLPQVDKVVLGVQSLKQLDELMDVAKTPKDDYDLSSLKTSDRDLIDPSRWDKL